ncbi:MAG: CapA family protein [Clostridiales bacterium]|nr:CapA family protein [Clostridiales bacterium]
MKKEIILYGVGDLGPCRDKPESIFQDVSHIFKEGDISFGQLEPVFSRRGTPLPQSRLPMRCDPAGAKAIKDAGFDVISFATNHCMDWGREAFYDTIEALNNQNLLCIGAGKDIFEARKSVIIKRDDTKVAFLGYNSILPQGYFADERRPGCAPLRGFTIYEQIEHDQPGTPARIHTYPHRDDMKALIADVKKAKEEADIVIVSIHWGLHFIPSVIADYQRDYAYAAIDAGADLILGHHSHILKPIEVYKRKVIFYSLANFALDPPHKFAEGGVLSGKSHTELQELNPDWKKAPEKPMPTDSFKTIIAKCYIEDKKIIKVSYMPVDINMDTYNPKAVTADSPKFDEIMNYMSQITKEQKINTEYLKNMDEVEIVL